MRQKMTSWIPVMGPAAIAAVVLVVAASPASAQRAGRGGRFGQNGQNGQNGQAGAPGGGGFGGQRMRQRPAPTLATIPVSAMTPYFGLTDEQAKKIDDLQKGSRTGMEAIRTSAQQMFQNGTRPDRQQMAAMQTQMAKVQTDQEEAAREIGRVLNSEQRPQIASFLRDVELFGKVTLPLELIKPLALDGPQKRKLQTLSEESDADRQKRMTEAFQTMRQNRQNNTTDPNADPNAAGANGRQAGFAAVGEAMTSSAKQTHEQVLAILTPEQRTLVENWDKEHPGASTNPMGAMGAMGGFGRFGGTGGGRGAAGATTPPAP